MGRSRDDRSKRGLAMAALLFATMLCMAGCGKADKAYDKAMDLAEEGKYEQAAESFEEAIKLKGEKAEYYIGYGMTLNHLGKYKKAVKQFEKAYQEVDNKISRKNNKQLYYGEALAYYGMHKFDQAIECCNDALEISGQAEINSNIYAIMAVTYLASGDTDKALDSFNQLIKDNKKDALGYLQRGQLYLYMGEQESALSDFSQALQLDQQCYDAYFGLYDAYTQSGQDDAAKESLEMLTGIHAKSAEQKMQVGRAYLVLGEEDQAVSYLKDAVEHKCKEGNYYLGMVQMAKKDYSSALDYFEKYIKEATAITIPEVYNQMAGCLIEEKEYDQAAEYLEKGLELGVTSAYQGLLKNQVILLERQQDFTAAKKAAKTYLEAYPEDAAMQKELKFIKTRIKKKTTSGNQDKKKEDGQTTSQEDSTSNNQSTASPDSTADVASTTEPDHESDGQSTADPAGTADAQATSDTKDTLDAAATPMQ